MNREVLTVIPARGGSKGMPGKNILPLAGKPLIGWTIEASLACPAVSRTLVTTDSQEIYDVAASFGAETPFLRPAELAADDTPGMLPILHAVRWMEEHEGYKPFYVMVLQPTSPLRTSQDIAGAIELCESKQADAVVSLTAAPCHPFWMKRLDEQGRIFDFNSNCQVSPVRQNLPKAYALNGAIYLARRDVLLEAKTWYTDKTFGYLMPRERSLDIDEPWDFHLANLVVRDRERI
jgi:N-acylneuraminate cytidylyltransferase/CMP-N,N'-diacetyllegionaminic acid synthase